MNEGNNFIPVKIIVVCSINVGKSSLITKYSKRIYSTNSKSIRNASFLTKIRKVNGVKYKIVLWDIAVQEIYNSLT